MDEELARDRPHNRSIRGEIAWSRSGEKVWSVYRARRAKYLSQKISYLILVYSMWKLTHLHGQYLESRCRPVCGVQECNIAAQVHLQVV
jgi:hypothetical protein